MDKNQSLNRKCSWHSRHSGLLQPDKLEGNSVLGPPLLKVSAQAQTEYDSATPDTQQSNTKTKHNRGKAKDCWDFLKRRSAWGGNIEAPRTGEHVYHFRYLAMALCRPIPGPPSVGQPALGQGSSCPLRLCSVPQPQVPACHLTTPHRDSGRARPSRQLPGRRPCHQFMGKWH